MNCPLVSIIIPSYNREKLLPRAIESALNQSYEEIEVIVQDNCSTDNSWAVLEELAALDYRLSIEKNEANLGPLANWERALARAKGDYIKILWSDDSIELDFVQACLDILEKRADIGLVFTSTEIHIKSKKLLAYHHPDKELMKSRDYVLWTMLDRNLPVSPGCAMLRRKDAKFLRLQSKNPQLQEIAESLGAGPDVLFLFNAASRYPYVGHIPRVLSHYYGNSSSLTLQHKKRVQLAYELSYRHLLFESNESFYHSLRVSYRFERFKRRLRRLMKKISTFAGVKS